MLRLSRFVTPCAGRAALLRTSAVVLTLGVALARPAAAQFGSNLIVNGNAESGAGSTDGGVVPVPGWTPTGTFTVVRYDVGSGFPASTDAGPANRGVNFFAGGETAAISTGMQTFSFTMFAGLGSIVNAGNVGYTLSGWFGGFAGQNDNAVLTAQFLDAGATPIGSTSVGGVSANDRAGVTGLLFRTLSGAVPIGAQSVRFTLTMTRTEGTYNDGYADNLAFVLTNNTPTTTAPEPTTIALVGAGLVAAGLVRRRRSA